MRTNEPFLLDAAAAAHSELLAGVATVRHMRLRVPGGAAGRSCELNPVQEYEQGYEHTA